MKARSTIQKELREAERCWRTRLHSETDYQYLRGIEFALAWVIEEGAIRPTKLVAEDKP